MIKNLRERLNMARKGKNELQLKLLQTILGEVSTLQARTNKEPTTEQVEKVVRSIRNRNLEVITLVQGKGQDKWVENLEKENIYLGELVPETLSVEAIKAQLSLNEMRGAKNEGMAMGLAMKFLKSTNLKVLGDDVKKAVQELRSMPLVSEGQP